MLKIIALSLNIVVAMTIPAFTVGYSDICPQELTNEQIEKLKGGQQLTINQGQLKLVDDLGAVYIKQLE